MAVEYSPAPEVEEIALRLIKKYYPELSASDIRIEYVFRSEALKTRGKQVLGKARKVTGLNAHLAQRDGDESEFFVLEIAADIWKLLTAAQQEALVDHELMHFVVKEDFTLAIRAHDLEEFATIVRRHGLWQPDVEFFAKAVQERLPIGGVQTI
jgi:hypothetical protein